MRAVRGYLACAHALLRWHHNEITPATAAVKWSCMILPQFDANKWGGSGTQTCGMQVSFQKLYVQQLTKAFIFFLVQNVVQNKFRQRNSKRYSIATIMQPSVQSWNKNFKCLSSARDNKIWSHTTHQKIIEGKWEALKLSLFNCFYQKKPRAEFERYVFPLKAFLIITSVRIAGN